MQKFFSPIGYIKKINFISFLKEIFAMSPRSGRTIAICVLILIFIKQIILYLTYGSQLQGSRFLETVFNYLGFFANDFILFGIILFLVFINLLFKVKWFKIISIIINSILLIFFIVDIVTIYYFQSRLSIFELLQFVSFSNASIFFKYFIVGIGIFFASIIAIFIFVQKYLAWTKNSKKQISIVIRFFVFSLFFSFINFLSYKYQSLQENVLLLNMRAFKKKIVGNEYFLEKEDKTKKDTNFFDRQKEYEDYFTYINGKKKRLNVILVFAESFSTVDSKRAGGLYNNFPLFDKIQAEGITFKNFMANGCTSETAHIALLQGVEPRQNPLEKQQDSYYNYANYTEALPIFFNDLGYDTTFLSTVTLDFLGQRNFLKNLQFKTIIGEEAFKNEKKYVFDAAPDHVLYKKALHRVFSGEHKKPFFLVMQTVSSHKPYNTPYGKSSEEMFSYVDKNMYAFYQKLKAGGFFNNGLLLIIGDHRKMESIPTEEFKVYGMSSHSRALATVIGSGIKSNAFDERIIQHVDIFYSLKYLFGSGKVLVRKDFNNIFKPSQKNRDRGVRYCRFSEKHYAVIKDDLSAYTLQKDKDPYIRNYITAYKKFQYKKLVGTGYDSLYFTNFVIGTGKSYDFTIIAHRGDPSETTDNSLKGFKLAKENQADGIEFDVSFTKDGHNVVYHGPSLNNTLCGKDKKIYEYTLKELQTKCKLKNGETIMTLEDALLQTDGRFDKYFIEIKVHQPEKAEEQTLDAIQTVTRYGFQDRVIFISYDKTANYLIGSYKGINAGWDTMDKWHIGVIGNFPHQYFLMPQNMIDEEIVKISEILKKKLVVYTVNTEKEFDRMYKLGIKNIMTDNVPLIKKILKKYTIPQKQAKILKKSSK